MRHRAFDLNGDEKYSCVSTVYVFKGSRVVASDASHVFTRWRLFPLWSVNQPSFRLRQILVNRGLLLFSKNDFVSAQENFEKAATAAAANQCPRKESEGECRGHDRFPHSLD